MSDARLAPHAMTTPDLRDPAGVPGIPVAAGRVPGAGPVRVTVVRGTEGVKNHPAVDAVVADAAARLALAGHFAVAATVRGERPDLETCISGWGRRATLITRLRQLLTTEWLVLTPVCAEPPFGQDADLAGARRSGEFFPAMWPMAAVPVLGFPAVTVPVAPHEGLPLGVQLIGGRFTEDLVLDAARAVEERSPLPRAWATA